MTEPVTDPASAGRDRDPATRLSGVLALLMGRRFTADDGDDLVETTVDGTGHPVSMVLSNRAVRMLSEAALGARIVAALDRAREPAAAAAAALLADRLGAAPPAGAGDGDADQGAELAAVETAHDATGTVAATVNALGELYDVRLSRGVLELDRALLAARVADAEQAAYLAALRGWAESPARLPR